MSLENDQLLEILEARFGKNKGRHKAIQWTDVESRLQSNPSKLKSLQAMEDTGGEPDVIGIDKSGHYIFCDCSAESPAGRRSLCYDPEALDSRKEHKPAGSAVELADKMGVEILDEEQYKRLQQTGPFDQKTSSWLRTPEEVRKLGGALFGDWRYGRVFSYHNGAQSYYASRGFRGLLLV